MYVSATRVVRQEKDEGGECFRLTLSYLEYLTNPILHGPKEGTTDPIPTPTIKTFLERSTLPDVEN